MLVSNSVSTFFVPKTAHRIPCIYLIMNLFTA